MPEPAVAAMLLQSQEITLFQGQTGEGGIRTREASVNSPPGLANRCAQTRKTRRKQQIRRIRRSVLAVRLALFAPKTGLPTRAWRGLWRPGRCWPNPSALPWTRWSRRPALATGKGARSERHTHSSPATEPGRFPGRPEAPRSLPAGAGRRRMHRAGRGRRWGGRWASPPAVLEPPRTSAYPVGHSWHVLPAAMRPADGADPWRAEDSRDSGRHYAG